MAGRVADAVSLDKVSYFEIATKFKIATLRYHLALKVQIMVQILSSIFTVLFERIVKICGNDCESQLVQKFKHLFNIFHFYQGI